MKHSKNSFFNKLSPQAGLLMGTFAAVLILLLVGFIILLSIFLNQEGAPSVLSDNRAAVNNQANNNNQAQPVQIENIGQNEYVRGNRQADVELIVFSDYECAYCKQMHATLQQAYDEYGDQLAWIYRHFPLDSIHDYARLTAEAAECAGDQNAFWEFTDAVFENQDQLDDDYLYSLATDLNLQIDEFDDCLQNGEYSSKVDSDFRQGRAAGVTGTPGTFVNGELLKGAVPYNVLQQRIDRALAN